MAYREFHYEKQYAAPDASQYMDHSTQAISNLFQQIAKRRDERIRATNQFEYDLSNGKFENDQKILSEFANNVVSRGKQDIYHTGKITNNTAGMMVQGKAYQQISAVQHEKTKALQSEILSRDAKDPYYDSAADLNKLKIAANGEDGEVNFLTRGQRLNDVEKQLGGLDSFKYNNYRADYIKNKGQQYKEQTSGNPNATKTRYDQATFWDDTTGKPGVTDPQAIDYLNSDPQGRIDQYFNRKVNAQLEDEIKKMKSSGDSRVSWMKGKSDADIKNELINDPSKNIINSQDYGVRKRNLAKADLHEADRINSKVSVDYKAEKNDNGLYKNNNIVHSYSFNTPQAVGAIPGKQANAYENPGPGGVLFQKNGKPITLTISNPIRTNINTGKTNAHKIGSTPVNVTGYQMQAFTDQGYPVLLHGSDTESMVDYINKMPLEYFDPKGKYRFQPEMKVALQGWTLNQAHILNAANNNEQAIQSRISDAENNNDSDKVSVEEDNLQKIKAIKNLIASGVDDQELALAASRAGITGVQVNELFQASDQDLANINAITQGFDLKNKNNHSPDMIMVADAWRNRAKQAAESGYSPQSQATSKNKKLKNSVPTVTSAEDYAKIPVGGEYIDADGNLRTRSK